LDNFFWADAQAISDRSYARLHWLVEQGLVSVLEFAISRGVLLGFIVDGMGGKNV
jgi:hypothetical protein